MNDFGMPPGEMYALNVKTGILPLKTDTYDPSSPWLGNSALKGLYDSRVLKKASEASKYCSQEDVD